MKLVVLVSILMAGMTASAAQKMICKGQVVTQSFEIKGSQIEMLSSYNGQTLPSVHSLADLEDGVLYLGDQVQGKAYDFENCKMTDYRMISGVVGTAGVRLLPNTAKSCVCN